MARQNSKRQPIYKGLDSFGEDDGNIFFGREEERERLYYQLRSNRLTILYGPRQVGKTSLIRAGIVPYLKDLTQDQLQRGGAELSWIVFDEWANSNVVGTLTERIYQKLQEVQAPATQNVASTEGLLGVCQLLTKSLGEYGGEFFLILDQFEDYLRSNPRQSNNPFDLELINILSARGLAVNVLIVIRDDYLAGMDRYRCKISDIYSGLLRVEPFTEKQACDAILNPLYYFNEQQQVADNVSIEHGLVAAVLDSVSCEAESGELIETKGLSSDRYFSPPAIQLVMKFLWDSMSPKKTAQLSFAGYTELGGFEGVCEQYLDGLSEKFKAKERNLVVKVIDILVTPGGMGLAFPLRQLAEKLGVKHQEISGLIEKMCKNGLLVGIPQPGGVNNNRYEIKQRILTQAFLTRVRNFRADCFKQESDLVKSIETCRIQFKHESQLSGLGNAIKTVERFIKAREELVVSNEHEMRFLKTLDTMQRKFCQIAQLGSYKGAVSSIAFGFGGRQILTGEETGQIRYWDLNNQSYQVLTPLHQNWVWALAVSLNGEWMATAADDGRVMLWKLSNEAPSFLWEIAPLLSSGNTHSVRGLGFNPNTSLLAISDTCGHIRIVDLKSKSEKSHFQISQSDIVPVRCVEFVADGEFLVVGSDDGLLRLYDLDGVCLCDTSKEDNGHQAEVWGLSYHAPSGHCIASASQDHTVKLWRLIHLEEGKPEIKFKETFTGHTCSVLNVAFSPDGNLVASSSEDGSACLWDLQGTSLAKFVHGGPVNDVAFSRDGKQLATAAADFRARIWNVEQGIQVWRREEFCRSEKLEILLDLAISRNGEHIVTGGTGKVARLWAANGQLLNSYPAHDGYILQVDLAPDGQSFVTGSFDGTAKVWEVGENSTPLAVLRHETLVLALAYSPDGRLILTGSADGSYRIWDWRSQILLSEFSPQQAHGPLWSLCFHPTEDSFFCGYHDGSIIQYGHSRESRNEPLHYHAAPVLNLSCDPTGSFLASSTSDGQVHILELSTHENFKLKGSHAPVWGLAFNTKGNVLVSGCLDRSVCVFDLNTKAKLDSFSCNAPVRGVAMVGDEGNEQVFAACSDGSVKRWPLAQKTLKESLAVCNALLEGCLVLGGEKEQ